MAIAVVKERAKGPNADVPEGDAPSMWGLGDPGRDIFDRMWNGEWKGCNSRDSLIPPLTDVTHLFETRPLAFLFHCGLLKNKLGMQRGATVRCGLRRASRLGGRWAGSGLVAILRTNRRGPRCWGRLATAFPAASRARVLFLRFALPESRRQALRAMEEETAPLGTRLPSLGKAPGQPGLGWMRPGTKPAGNPI